MLDSLNKFKNSFKYYTELRVQENRILGLVYAKW